MKIIQVKFVRIGASVQVVKLFENSQVKDLVRALNITIKNGAFFRKGTKLNLETKLNDGDILIYSFSIQGEATVKRNGEIWRIHKSDPDNLIPSNFHAHNMADYRETLDLYTGYIYKLHSRNIIAKLSDKDHKAVLEILVKSNNSQFREKANNILGNM